MAERPKKKPVSKSAAPAAGKGTKKGFESMGFFVLIALILTAANVVGYFVLRERIDLTKNRSYSLSDGSRNLVSDLDESLLITAYFSADQPPPFNATEQYLRNLLKEYEAASGGKIRVRFVNPDDDDEKEAARRDGVSEVQVPVIENDARGVRASFRGLVLRYLREKEVIGVVQSNEGLEYAITRAIQKLVREPLPIGVLSGHGSPGPTKGLSTLRSSLPHYELREVNANEEISRDIRALLIVNPTEAITDTEQRRINQYVMRGGSLGVFGGTMNVELQGMGGPAANKVETGINNLLRRWGVSIGNSILADAQCQQVPLSRQFPIPVPFPPAPIVAFTDDQQEEQVTYRLRGATFFFTSPISTRQEFRQLHGEVLARSSAESSWLLEGDHVELRPRAPNEWRSTIRDQPRSRPMLVSLRGRLPSAFPGGQSGSGPQIEAPSRAQRNVRVLVSGTSWLLRDELLPPPEQQQQGQMNGSLALALNAVDWLAQDADLIALRAKNIEDPELRVPRNLFTIGQEAITHQAQAEEANAQGDEHGSEEHTRESRQAIDRYKALEDEWNAKKSTYQWGIGLGLPLLVALFGLLWWWMRSNRRTSMSQLRSELSGVPARAPKAPPRPAGKRPAAKRASKR